MRAAADKITADALWRDLEFLASDELAGRNTPSAGFDTAAQLHRRNGFWSAFPTSLLGDDRTFLQHYDLHQASVDAAAAYLEMNGRRFTLGPDFVLRSFAGNP